METVCPCLASSRESSGQATEGPPYRGANVATTCRILMGAAFSVFSCPRACSRLSVRRRIQATLLHGPASPWALRNPKHARTGCDSDRPRLPTCNSASQTPATHPEFLRRSGESSNSFKARVNSSVFPSPNTIPPVEHFGIAPLEEPITGMPVTLPARRPSRIAPSTVASNRTAARRCLHSGETARPAHNARPARARFAPDAWPSLLSDFVFERPAPTNSSFHGSDRS